MNYKFTKGIQLLILYFLIMLVYRFIIAENFNYLGFHIEGFSFNKLFFSSFFAIFLIGLSSFIKNEYYRLIYNICFVMLFIGQSIYYVYNSSNFILVVYMAVPLIFIFILDYFTNEKDRKFSNPKFSMKDSTTYYFFLFITILLTLPFFQNIGSINWRNLLFLEIYETRVADDSDVDGILGYIFSPLSRVILPFLFIYSINNKKFLLTILTSINIIMIFLLNGALKSIIIGFIAAIFFYSGSYLKKNYRFIVSIILLHLVSIIEFAMLDSYNIADYLRRIFFTPASLFQVYLNYFDENFTYFTHSRFVSIFGSTNYETYIPIFIGEQVLGVKNLSANVGIFVEGFFSFGSIGVIIVSLIFVLFILFLNKLDLKPEYFGIIFSYLYIINTSFIETLLLTHGLMFLFIFSIFFIPSSRQYNR